MAQLNTTCPVCGAPHARKLSVIHAEGLSTVRTNIDTVGTFNTTGRQKIKTKGTANGVQQTQASKDAARPVVPPLISLGRVRQGLAVFIGGFVLIFGFGTNSGLATAAGVLIALCAFFISGDPTPEEIEDYNERTGELREAANCWDETFQCGACSHRFVPLQVEAA